MFKDWEVKEQVFKGQQPRVEKSIIKSDEVQAFNYQKVPSLSGKQRPGAWVEADFTVGAVDRQLFEYYGIQMPNNFERMVDKRRSEYLAGRLCAGSALHDLGVEGQVVIGSHGSPLWPEGCVGSISHTGGRAVACVALKSQYRAIGVDIEKIMSSETAKEVAPLLLAGDEDKYLVSKHAGSTNFAHFVTQLFSAKEALFKAIYAEVGEIFGFEAAACVSINHQCWVFEIQQDLSMMWQTGDLITVLSDRKGALVYSVVAL